MNKVSFFAELLARLKTKSPKFFKNLQTALMTLAVVLEALTWLHQVWPLPEVVLPFIGHDSAIYVAILAVIAKLPVEDTDHLEEKLKK
jgi:uncharacterized membrane protein